MSNVLVINAAGPETRVALVENGSISEFYLERKKDKGIVGNIYKGKVVRVLPGMQAAFVDIGLEKAAFLYVGDVAGGPDFSEEFEIGETPEGEHGEPPAGDVPDENEAAAADSAPAAETPEHTHAIADEPAPDADTAAEDAAVDAFEAANGVLSIDATIEGPSFDGPVPPPEPVGSEAVSSDTAASEAPVAEAGAEAAVDAPADASASPETSPGEPVAAAPAAPQKGQLKARIEPLARKKRRDDAPKGKQEPRPSKNAQIQDLLKEGQEVIVQVVKDPIGSKGARVTCHISLPGRHLVFMPTVDHVGISRRIDNEKERRRLRELVDALRPAGTGFIVRTVADKVDREKLEADIKFLLGLWNDMARKKDKLRAPALLHPDLDLILRSVRDLFSSEVEKLVIDDRQEYERILGFVKENVPHLAHTIEFFEGREPIFDAYGIEQELRRAASRKVWLKSGGYLIIDQAEALVAIDVNSGRFVGKKSLEETITTINQEAAREIVYQLRLRNIGGIIIIDFIDMEKQANREKVFKALQEALGRDRAKTNIVKISELGLVEMTRKRVRESVGRMMNTPCTACDGRGYLKSYTTVAYEIFREIQRKALAHREDSLVVSCHPEVAKYVTQEEREAHRHLMNRWNKTITLRPVGSFHQEQFEIQAKWSRRDDAPKQAAAAPPPRPAAPKPAAPPPAPAVAAQVKAVNQEADDGEGEDDEDDDETPAAGAAPAQPGQANANGQANGKRRRRRRRGRGGGQPPAAGGAAPPPAGGRPPAASGS